MEMNSLRVAIIFLASITATPVLAQSPAPASPPETAAQLEQLMAPIALYPDELAGAILMASTYPLSRAEVPVVGLIGNRALSGQIDRLRPAPASEAEIPAFYLDQLAAYVAAVQAIYPKKRVRAALLWTDGPRLMPVSPERLQAG